MNNIYYLSLGGKIVPSRYMAAANSFKKPQMIPTDARRKTKVMYLSISLDSIYLLPATQITITLNVFLGSKFHVGTCLIVDITVHSTCMSAM